MRPISWSKISSVEWCRGRPWASLSGQYVPILTPAWVADAAGLTV
jgi:hypothetical protein